MTNEKLTAFVNAYGVVGATLILKEASAVMRGDRKPSLELAKELDAIAAALLDIANENMGTK